jgi:hypothetical protein
MRNLAEQGSGSTASSRPVCHTGDGEEKLELAVKSVSGLLDALLEVRGY